MLKESITTDPRLQWLYDYWLEKRGTRLAPRRDDMEAKDFKNILPIIYILDVVGPPPCRFRFRLTGTRFVEEYGEDVIGRFVDQIDLDDHEKPILAEYECVARSGQPSSTKWDYTKHDGRHLSYEHLILPLSSDGAKIDMLFGAADMRGVG